MADALTLTPDQLAQLVKDNPDTLSFIIDIATKLDSAWFDMAFKIALVAVVFLCFREVIFSVYRYLILRMDKYIGIGTVIKFNHGVYGKICGYNLRTIAISTKEGIVRIPLQVWLSTYYTQITIFNVPVSELNDITEIKQINSTQDEKLEYLYTDLVNLKKKLDETITSNESKKQSEPTQSVQSS